MRTARRRIANALSGVGEIYLRDGQVRQYSLLVALGQLLQIDELSQLRLDQAQVKYHITPGVVTIDELLLSFAEHSALGDRHDQLLRASCDSNSQLAINERIRSQLFAAMRENFQPIEQPGFAAVDFEVTGTVERPKTNLMDKIVGPGSEGSRRRDQQLARRRKSGASEEERKHRKKQRRRAAAASAAAPSDAATSAEQPSPGADASRALRQPTRIAMRVIAGSAGGIRLAVPETDVRPTMDRVKAAIFSSLRRARRSARACSISSPAPVRSASRRSVAGLPRRSSWKRIAPPSGRSSRISSARNCADACGSRKSSRFSSPPARSERFDIIFADPPYEKTKSWRRVHAAAARECEARGAARVLMESSCSRSDRTRNSFSSALWERRPGEEVWRDRGALPGACCSRRPRALPRAE